MLLILATILQAVTGSPPEKIDLTVRRSCTAHEQASNEVTVCGRRTADVDPYRIRHILGKQSDLPKADLQIAEGVGVSAETEDVNVGGFQSNRGMLRLKVKF